MKYLKKINLHLNNLVNKIYFLIIIYLTLFRIAKSILDN